MLNKIAYKTALAGLLTSLCGTASALGDQWYVGIGGGISRLNPDITDTATDTSDDSGQVSTIFIGTDFDNRSSGQLQLYSLGDAQYSDGQNPAGYTAGDASLLYRFYDSRDTKPRGTLFGTSLYGRFGFGFMQRDSDLPLGTDSPVYFGAGAGVETYLGFNLAMRLEALYHDTDATSATLSLVSRFGGRRQTAPEHTQAEAHVVAIKATDSDSDGIEDERDQCSNSTPGYPITGHGCPAFQGMQPDLNFEEGVAVLLPGSVVALDSLVAQLRDYPDANIEIVAHTDNSDIEARQSELTRQRLRSIGAYLVRHGISQDRLLLRSFGGSRPDFDNTTADGRQRNNRIEIFENP